MMYFGKTSMIVAAVLSFVLAATMPVQAQLQQGSGPFCINDLMCAGVPGSVNPPTCMGCPKQDEDSGSTGDCEFTLPDTDSGSTSKDGKSKSGKDKKKSRRRRLKSSSGDDDDDSEDQGGINGDPVFNANCCDCSCIKKTEDEACTCICYGFIDPTDSTTIGGSSKDGKSKSGKDKKKSRRRRHLGSEDEEDLTVHEEETHVRSRLAKRVDNVEEASEGGWHSWLLNSLWGSDDEELEVIDQSNRKLKKKKGKGGKGSKKKSSSDDDGGNDGGSTSPPTNEDGTTICPEPPRQCFYIKRDEGNGATATAEQTCQINTYGKCALTSDLNFML